MRIAVLIFVTIVAAVLVHPAAPDHSESVSLSQSMLNKGNLIRLQRVLAKARRGEPVTVGFIGGSITFGERATAADRTYPYRIACWFVDHFPQSKITIVNAGLPGTGSNYGCLRAGRDLLCQHPDFVIVEFGVNDRDDLAHAQTYEGLVRQIFSDPGKPAAVLLFMMHHDGTNAQAMQSEIGRRYQLPMVSFRDAVWPAILDGRMKVSDVLADTVHPNDRGHAVTAACIAQLLQNVMASNPKEIETELPKPRFTDLFARTRLLEAGELKPISNQGWSFDVAKHCWAATLPGSVIQFDMPGSVTDLLYNRVSTKGGTAIVTVDEGPQVLCDAWFDGTWAGHCQTDVVGLNLTPGMHRVRIELLDEQNALSTGHEFEILGLGSAG